ncbi:hypothetical protein L195_g044860, partial [Trifolium pratense]
RTLDLYSLYHGGPLLRHRGHSFLVYGAPPHSLWRPYCEKRPPPPTPPPPPICMPPLS